MSYILNKHGQRVYYFINQPGNTELEKCLNFNKAMGVSTVQYPLVDINGNTIECVVVYNSNTAGVEVFNDKGEKTFEFEDLMDETKDSLIEVLSEEGIV